MRHQDLNRDTPGTRSPSPRVPRCVRSVVLALSFFLTLSSPDPVLALMAVAAQPLQSHSPSNTAATLSPSGIAVLAGTRLHVSEWNFGNILAELLTGGAEVNFTLSLPELDSPLERSPPSGVHETLLTDHLMTALESIDDTGAVVRTTEYAAYGGVRAGADPETIGFAGARRDPKTGLLNLRNRWYSPELLRFLSRDPTGLVGLAGLNVAISRAPLSLQEAAARGPTDLSPPAGIPVYSSPPFAAQPAAGLGASLDPNLYRYSNGAPNLQRDPTGLAPVTPEVVWDAVNVGLDAKDLWDDPSIWTLGTLAADATSLCIPVLPAVVGPLIRAKRFRDRLIRFTGIDPGKLFHAHHVFPVELADRFAKYLININDPKFGAWWEATKHLAKSHEYSVKWQQFLAQVPPPRLDEVMAFARRLAAHYGFKVHF